MVGLGSPRPVRRGRPPRLEVAGDRAPTFGLLHEIAPSPRRDPARRRADPYRNTFPITFLEATKLTCGSDGLARTGFSLPGRRGPTEAGSVRHVSALSRVATQPEHPGLPHPRRARRSIRLEGPHPGHWRSRLHRLECRPPAFATEGRRVVVSDWLGHGRQVAQPARRRPARRDPA